MTWDATAQQLCMSVIGTVESNLTYDAVNLVDPITIGVAQWYGNRAAALLDRFKNESPSTWNGVTSSLESYIDNYASSDPVWDTLYLDSADANSIKPILINDANIQNDQFTKDVQSYATVAQNQGMDINANTNSLIFFCTMYHQNPREALAVMAAAGPNASLDRYKSICDNDTIFSQYPQRYQKAYDMIIAGTATGITNTPTQSPTTPVSGNTSGGTGATQTLGQVAYISKVGDHLKVTGGSGSVFAYSDGKGNYISASPYAPNSSPVVQPPNNPTPPSPPPAGTSSGQALVNWMAAHADAYNYGQGPGRLTPDTSGYTDCSGLCYWCYMQVLGINIGTWGGDQIHNGTLIATGTDSIDTSSLQMGDLIFYEWNVDPDPVNYNHTAMYAGNGQVWSHGGGQGPNLIPITGDYSGVVPIAIMARRYI